MTDRQVKIKIEQIEEQIESLRQNHGDIKIIEKLLHEWAKWQLMLCKG